MAQNRRLRDWRIANSSECNNDKCIRITNGREVKHWSRRRIPVRLHSIINIIIVMSTVGSATIAFYESLASEQGYRAAYVNKYDRTTLFYAKRVTAVSSPGETMRQTASRNIRICARLNDKKFSDPEEVAFLTLHDSGSLGNKVHQQWALIVATASMKISLSFLFRFNPLTVFAFFKYKRKNVCILIK